MQLRTSAELQPERGGSTNPKINEGLKGRSWAECGRGRRGSRALAVPSLRDDPQARRLVHEALRRRGGPGARRAGPQREAGVEAVEVAVGEQRGRGRAVLAGESCHLPPPHSPTGRREGWPR